MLIAAGALLLLAAVGAAGQAPHFYGWHFRLVSDGRTVTRLDYRDHTVL